MPCDVTASRTEELNVIRVHAFRCSEASHVAAALAKRLKETIKAMGALVGNGLGDEIATPMVGAASSMPTKMPNTKMQHIVIERDLRGT